MSDARQTDERVNSRVRVARTVASSERIGFVWGALTNVLTTTIAYSVSPHAQLAHLMIIHLLGAVLISTRYGMTVSTVTAVTGVLAFDYFCIPPVFAFAMPDPRNVVSFLGMLLVALLVCWLNQGLRYQRAAARKSEERTQALCQLSLELSQVTSVEELLVRAQSHLCELFGEQAELCLTQAEPPPRAVFSTHAVGDRGDRLGYIRVVNETDVRRRADRQLLLAASADRISDALRLLSFGEATRRAEVDAEVERNRNVLLSAVSHDMKTPLASILTASSSLLSASQRDSVERELLETIVQESERMNALITNLLSATRLESGGVTLNQELEALDDLVFGVLSRLSNRLAARNVRVDIPGHLPMLSVDAVLIDQLLVNLLENALRYSDSRSAIEVRARAEHDVVMVEVCDRGPGIPEADRERVFDKFYRGQAAKRNDGGTGLGLTICRAVVVAHGGQIAVVGRRGGGTKVRFSLPLSARPRLRSSPAFERRTQA